MIVWLDDVRPMPEDYTVWAKTCEEAIDALKTGQVTAMSFDHDLGEGMRTGYDVAKWVEAEAYAGRLNPFSWFVHPDNPAGAKRIRAAMTKACEYWEGVSS